MFRACNYERRCGTLKAHDPDRGGPGPVLSLRRNSMPGTKELVPMTTEGQRKGNRAGNPRPARGACPDWPGLNCVAACLEPVDSGTPAARLDTLAYVLDMAIMQANEAIGPED